MSQPPPATVGDIAQLLHIHVDQRAGIVVLVLPFWPELWPCTPPAGSPSNASCPTTARPTAQPWWHIASAQLGITVNETRPYRPQTNGKIERFHRTMADGWAYTHHYLSEAERRAALTGWLHEYNHYRPRSAIGGKPPISRITNLPGQYT